MEKNLPPANVTIPTTTKQKYQMYLKLYNKKHFPKINPLLT